MSTTIEAKIDKLFDDAIDVNDTVWYMDNYTLRDAIMNTIYEHFDIESSEFAHLSHMMNR